MDKKKEKQSVLQLMFIFMDRANGDHVGAYASPGCIFPDYVFYSVYSVSHDYNSIYTFNIQYGQRNHPGICAPLIYRILCLPLYQKYMAEARR